MHKLETYLVSLNTTTMYLADLNCPHCDRCVDAKWHNDDPIGGDYVEKCPYCSKEIKFHVSVCPDYIVEKL